MGSQNVAVHLCMKMPCNNLSCEAATLIEPFTHARSVRANDFTETMFVMGISVLSSRQVLRVGTVCFPVDVAQHKISLADRCTQHAGRVGWSLLLAWLYFSITQLLEWK